MMMEQWFFSYWSRTKSLKIYTHGKGFFLGAKSPPYNCF